MEQVTHIIRAFLLAIAVFFMVAFESRGARFWALGGVLGGVVEGFLTCSSAGKGAEG